MSTFVLKREYALQLPNNYVEIDRDEMEYVDGGWSIEISKRTIAAAVVGVLAGIGAYQTVASIGKAIIRNAPKFIALVAKSSVATAFVAWLGIAIGVAAFTLALIYVTNTTVRFNI